MQKKMLWKLIILITVSVLLLLPLALIQDKVSERENYLFEVKHAINNSWTGEQNITSPILVLPYEIEKQRNITNQTGFVTGKETIIEEGNSYLVLDKVTVDAKVNTSKRYKGIYSVPIYQAKLSIRANLDSDSIKNKMAKIRTIEGFKKNKIPYLSFAFSDPRGLVSEPQIKLNSNLLELESGSGLFNLENGVKAYINQKNLSEDIKLDIQLELNGMEKLHLRPLAKSFTASVAANWPDPEFIGSFLPTKHNINDKQFSAVWTVNQFSTGLSGKLKNCENQDCYALFDTSFGINFYESVNVYLQTERAIKYAMLFIIVSFIAFFVFETMTGLAIHPIQYALVGLSLAIFYLLLIALSEHITFMKAYFISTAACVLLLLSYLRYVLQSWKNSSMFAAAIGGLYVMLYVILQMEDFALLTGALLTFSMLSILMLSTRKVNWYGDNNKA